MALVFDIETIADLSSDSREAIEALAAGREMTAEHYGALCPPLARVVCIAWYDTEQAQLGCAFDTRLHSGEAPALLDLATSIDSATAIACSLEACDGEPGLLTAFGTRLESHVGGSDPYLVTFNGRGFDLPVLLHRSVRCNLARGRAVLLKALNDNRYRPSLHIDLMDFLTFFGATSRWPLAAYALGYGLSSPKSEMDGSQVGPAVAAGRIVDVARYCAGDVRATAEVYRKVKAVDGWLPQRPSNEARPSSTT
ncbi:MAG TPA: hypothetical protein VMT89_12515 [Candidatus Acidoferrales bacterium]|nr:hypothetical protein [Candidatus Acidoferrales bacterium]